MTDATVSTASNAAPAVVVDIEATVAAAVAKEIAKLKADESAWITKIKTFVAAHYSKVFAAVAGWLTAHFGLVEAALKLI